MDVNGSASIYKQDSKIGIAHTLTNEGWSNHPFNPLLAPLAPRDLQNKLDLPQTIMTTYKEMIIK